MIVRKPHFYQRFRCLGGKCPLTCCRDWSIVPDEEALADYQNAPERLRQTIAENLATDDDGDVCFRLRPDGLCALLDGDGLCSIQRHWGEEHLCIHCDTYPRFIEEYGCLTESCQAISCPEAACLVMEEGILPLTETDDGVEDAPFDGVDRELLDGLIAGRQTAFDILTRRDRPIWDRLATLLRFAEDLQDCIDWDLPLNCPPPEGESAAEATLRAAQAARLMYRMAELAPLRPEWPELLLCQANTLDSLTAEELSAAWERYRTAVPQRELGLERLACYFVFRHWPKVVNDDLLYGRTALAAAACLVLYYLAVLTGEDEVLLWSRFSREIEHLDENFDTLVDELSDRALWPLL